MLVIFSCRVLQFTIMLLTVRLATTYLTPVEYGKMALLTTITSLICLLFINPVGMYISRHVHYWQEHGSLKRNTRIHWLYIFFISILSSLIVGILQNYNLWQINIDLFFIIVFVFSTVFFNTINQTVIPYLNMFGYINWFSILTVATVFLSLVSAIYLVEIMNYSAEVWLVGILLGQSIIGILGYYVFKYKVEFKNNNINKLNINNFKLIFIYIYPVMISTIFIWIQTQSYRFVLSNNYGLEQLGLFVAGYGVSAGIISGYESIITTYFQPIFYREISNKNLADHKDIISESWNKYVNTSMSLYLLLLIIIIILAPKLVKLILGPAFQDAVQYVIWAAYIEIFRVSAGVFSMGAHAIKQTNKLIYPNMIGAITCLLCIYILQDYYNILAICISLFLSGLIVNIYLYYKLSNIIKFIISPELFRKVFIFSINLFISNYLVDNILYNYIYIENILLQTMLQTFIIGLLFLSFIYVLIRKNLKLYY